jgi:HD-like signal output (HDOD) protein
MAGLLHDVGAVPILDYMGRHHPEVSEQEMHGIIEKLQGMVGEMVVGSWNLGPDVSQVVRESGKWFRNAHGKPDYCDIVLVARLYHMNETEPANQVPRYHEVPAFAKLGLGPPNDDLTLDIVENAREEMREMMAVIKGGA